MNFKSSTSKKKIYNYCFVITDGNFDLFILVRNEGKPDKPPNSGYSLFSKKLLSSNSLKQFETKERMSEISRMWKELSEEEKAAYNDKAHEVHQICV